MLSVVNRLMITTLFVFLSSAALFAIEPLPEMPDRPITKTEVCAILKQRWRIIEPMLFTPEGARYIGTEVRFDSSTVSIGKPVVVRTSAGITGRVFNPPKADMDVVRRFRKLPTRMAVSGVITAIDPATRTVSIKCSEIFPGK